MFLEKIIQHKRAELVKMKKEQPLTVLKQRISEPVAPRDFAGALTAHPPDNNTATTRIIAEVKKASPSKGIIREHFDPVALARSLEAHGAVALSVLTEKHFFQGDLSSLASIRRATTLPLLQKDFIIDPYQIYQARIYGADAVLLIAAILPDDLLSDLHALAHRLGLASLVEVHTLGELKRILPMHMPVIGINNRNLTTFRVTTQTTSDLINFIPEHTVVVSESGIHTKEDIRLLCERGVDAFLIGEALMKAPDPGKKLRELID